MQANSNRDGWGGGGSALIRKSDEIKPFERILLETEEFGWEVMSSCFVKTVL